MARHTELFAAPCLLLRRATAGLTVLAEQPLVDYDRLAAVGFCQGGITALELGRANAPIRAAIGFHPSYLRPSGSVDGSIRANVLTMSGSEDPFATDAAFDAFAAEMTAKAATWQLHLCGGAAHSFTDSTVDALGMAGMSYDSVADRMSWNMMRSLLEISLAS